LLRSSNNPAVQSVTIKDGKVLVGTKGCEILEIETELMKQLAKNQKENPYTINTINCPIMQAHCKGETWGVAAHPDKEEFVSGVVNVTSFHGLSMV
jgi:hypothetical protein